MLCATYSHYRLQNRISGSSLLVCSCDEMAQHSPALQVMRYYLTVQHFFYFVSEDIFLTFDICLISVMQIYLFQCIIGFLYPFYYRVLYTAHLNIYTRFILTSQFRSSYFTLYLWLKTMHSLLLYSILILFIFSFSFPIPDLRIIISSVFPLSLSSQTSAYLTLLGLCKPILKSVNFS